MVDSVSNFVALYMGQLNNVDVLVNIYNVYIISGHPVFVTDRYSFCRQAVICILSPIQNLENNVQYMIHRKPFKCCIYSSGLDLGKYAEI